MKQQGFTFIELLVAMVIVGILASVAYPSYMNNVRQANRTEAIAELQNILAAQERYFLENSVYAEKLTLLGFANSSHPIDHFTITTGECEDITDKTLCIKVTAKANTDQAKDGDIIMNSIGKAVLVRPGGIEVSL